MLLQPLLPHRRHLKHRRRPRLPRQSPKRMTRLKLPTRRLLVCSRRCASPLPRTRRQRSTSRKARITRRSCPRSPRTWRPAIEAWRGKGKPQYVEFVRVPAMWNDALRMHARLFYTAEALGKLDELHSTIFREIHVNNDPLSTVEQMTAFFKKHGVSADEFQKTFASFAVESKLQRADFLNRRFQINSVPQLAVNGKYLTDESMAGGEPELFQVIQELAAHEHGG
jgi:thiol:disulfide interchange protein DsbA